MRKGWEYKRFDEVFDLQMGKTPDRKNPEYFGGNNVWVSIRDLGDKEIADSNEHITNLAVCDTKIRKVKRGTVIMSFKLTVGKCGIAATDLYTNEAIMAFNPKESFDINSSFLYYYLQCYHWVGSNKAVMGITLNKATISKQYISLPPKSTQLAIVSELDKINELIRLKKEQLKDFDNLAQSLFYEMFGDPVENEKGWEVKKIKDIAKYYNGVAHEQDVDKDGDFVLINAKFISSEGQIKKYSSIQRFPLLKNDIVMVLSDLPNGKSLAKCFLIDEDNKYTLNQRICCFRGFEGSSVYLKNIINRNPYLLSFDNGKGQTNLRKGDVEKLPIPLPPLPLQRLFAQRIEQIEREKSEVQKSIQDLETLLASRMQYWFE